MAGPVAVPGIVLGVPEQKRQCVAMLAANAMPMLKQLPADALPLALGNHSDGTDRQRLDRLDQKANVRRSEQRVPDRAVAIPGDYRQAPVIAGVVGPQVADEVGLMEVGYTVVPGVVILKGEVVDEVEGFLVAGAFVADGNAQATSPRLRSWAPARHRAPAGAAARWSSSGHSGPRAPRCPGTRAGSPPARGASSSGRSGAGGRCRGR